MGTALWLSFKSLSRPDEIFTELIRKLRLKLSEVDVIVPVFKPHITIVSGLDYEFLNNNYNDTNLVHYLQHRLQALIKSCQMIKTSGLEFNDEIFFKSVVLKISKEPQFIDFVKEIRHELLLDLEPENWIVSYKPHLSLVYSDMEWADNDYLRDGVSNIIKDFNVELGSISLSDCVLEIVRCEGSPEKWVSLAQTTMESD